MPVKRDEPYTLKGFNCSKSAHNAISTIIGLAHKVGYATVRNQSEAIELAILELEKEIRKRYNESIEVY